MVDLFVLHTQQFKKRIFIDSPKEKDTFISYEVNKFTEAALELERKSPMTLVR